MQLILLTALTMVAFAANSVFARLALADGAIDAGSYSAVRLASGAIVLTVLATNIFIGSVTAEPFEKKSSAVVKRGGNMVSAAALLIYVAGFSIAYLVLDTGTGALILFACVQATMIGWGIVHGNKPSGLEWLGLVVAFGAFAYLVSPGLTAPDPFGTTLMVAAGIAWGVYSLRGRGVSNPLLETAGNFIRATGMMVALLVLIWIGLAVLGLTGFTIKLTGFGLLMAVLSGAVTSGLGYALWYRCLRELTATKAAIVQLSVPAIATLGGVVFSDEMLTLRLAFCSALILGGVGIAIAAKGKQV